MRLIKGREDLCPDEEGMQNFSQKIKVKIGQKIQKTDFDLAGASDYRAREGHVDM